MVCICSGKHLLKRFTALLLCFLILQIPLQMRQSAETDTGNDKLEWAFNWAKKSYLEGRYRETVEKLELLLSYFDKGGSTDHNELMELYIKIRLLLGAANEKLRRIEKARENYIKAQKSAVGRERNLEVEDIDFSSLVEYQRIIMGNKSVVFKERVIAKEVVKPKKKKISPFLIITGLAVAVGVAMLFLLKKKKAPDNVIIAEDYDIDVLSISWSWVGPCDFMMGDNFNEGDPDEQPVHRVHLDGYYISKYEITFRQYDIYCRERGVALVSDEGWGRGGRPAINVSYDSALDFCNWLSEKTGKTIRLPTEAQWENAARGPNQWRYPWGDSHRTCGWANHCCMDGPYVVGQYFRGESFYAAHDMSGNVSEWCRDWYDPFYYGNSPMDNPQGPSNPLQPPYYRVIRGGSWDCTTGLSIRSADRGWGPIGDAGRTNDVGFRVVWEGNSYSPSIR